jgi:hypothetical protein
MKTPAEFDPSQTQHETPPHNYQEKPPRRPDRDPGPESDLPCWFPAETSMLGLPKNVRQSLARAIAPAYRALVLNASGELERSLGNSVVYLTWLELVQQFHLAAAVADPTSLPAALQSPDELMDRYLQLVAAKCHAAGLVSKICLANAAINRLLPFPSPAGSRLPSPRRALQPDPVPSLDPNQFFYPIDQCDIHDPRPELEKRPHVDQQDPDGNDTATTVNFGNPTTR